MKDTILIFLHEELINVTNVVAPIVKLSRWQLNSPCDSTEEISLECCVTYNNIDDIEAKWMATVELSTNGNIYFKVSFRDCKQPSVLFAVCCITLILK